MTVASILKRKGTDVYTVRPDVTVGSAVREFEAKGIGALVVTEDGQTVLGLLGERDVVRGLSLYGARVSDLRVSDLMVRSVVTCTPDDTITAVMAAMTRHRARQLPVVEHHRLRGVVSIGDVVKFRLEELETEANILREGFIARQ